MVFVIGDGGFVGELGMLVGQRAFLPGVAVKETAVLRVRAGSDAKIARSSAAKRITPGPYVVANL